MAGGTHTVAAAFGNDAVDSILHGSQHDRGSDRNLDFSAGSVVLLVDDFGHANFILHDFCTNRTSESDEESFLTLPAQSPPKLGGLLTA